VRTNKDDDRKTTKTNKFKQMAEKRKHLSSGGGTPLFDLPDDVEMLAVTKGENRIDIIPYEVSVSNHPEVSKGETWCERTFYIHRGIGPEENWYVCPYKTMGDPCPICEERARLKKDENADEETLKALKPSMRQLFNVLNDDGDVVPWAFPHWNFGMLLEEEVRQSNDDTIGSFYELQGGKTLVVRFKERTSAKGSYLEASRIDFEDRKDIDEDVLKDAFDLDKILVVLSYEELEKSFLGTVASDTDNKDSDKDPDDSRDSRRSHRASRADKDKDDPDPDKDERDTRRRRRSARHED